MRPAVFLDRDGTMIREAGYLARFDDLVWFSYTADAIRLLNRAGFLVCVTTNQGGVGLGLYPESFVHEVHAHMTATLSAAGAHVDGWFYCPHHPLAVSEAYRQTCECRKPKGGMVRQATDRFDIDLPRSFVVGDKTGDIGLATSVGARGILVRTGHGEDTLKACGGALPEAACIAADLMAATAWLLAESGHPREGA